MDNPDVPSNDELPFQFTKKPADFILFFHIDDEEEANEFLQKVMSEGHAKGVNIVGYAYDEENFGGRELSNVDNITSIAVQTWFYITEKFAQDCMMLHYKDEHLMKSIMNGPYRNSVVPIWTKSKADYVEIPYGLVAYTGLNTQDPGLLRSIIRMFSKPQHQKLKEKLLEKQEKKKAQWIEHETARRQKEREHEDRKHQYDMDNIEADIEKNSTNTLQSKLDKIYEVLEKLNKTGRELVKKNRSPHRKRRSWVKDERESEIPEHLLDSLESQRSADSHTVVYRITINNPERVVLDGRTLPQTRDGNEAQTTVKHASSSDSDSSVMKETESPGGMVFDLAGADMDHVAPSDSPGFLDVQPLTSSSSSDADFVLLPDFSDIQVSKAPPRKNDE